MAEDRVRIYDIAKKLKLSNKDVLDFLDEKMNIKVKSHASTVSEAEADKLFNLLKSSTPAPKAPSAQPKVAPESPKEKTISKKSAPVKKEEIKTTEPVKEEKPPVKRPEGIQRPYDNRGPRPEGGQRPYGPRPEGIQRPYDNRGPRPEGGQRPFTPRPYGPRPEGGQRPYGPRPEGIQRPYDNRGPRPEGGQRPYTPRPEGGPRPYGPRPEGGQRPYTPRPEGGSRPYGPRPEGGQRPYTPRPYGPRPEGGQRPFTPRPEGPGRPQVPAKKYPGTRETVTPEIGKTPGRRVGVVKKKDKYKQDAFTKEEKLEQAKILQERFKKKKKSEKVEIKEKITEVFIDKPLTVGELAQKMDISVTEVVKQLMMAGILATVNQTIDVAAAKGVAEKLEFTVIEEEAEVAGEEKKEEEKTEVIDKSKLKSRAPVVTIMGHVDHGKTTLLDAIRSTKHKIVNSEVGGITQSIGAYTVNINNKKIVFIDTPGHEAFTAMRARGAQTTDIAILVIAADDGIMPQTIESINHAKAAKVPIIVAVNKIDKVGADPDKAMQQLTEYNLVPEKWGGDTICVPVSALQGTNLDELLEYILLVAEIEDLKTDPTSKASGVIIEARLDKGKGAVATLLVQNGTLKVGNYVVAGNVSGKIRSMVNDEGVRLKSAGPSTPVGISGLTEVPQSGDKFEAVESDKLMKIISTQRKEEERTSRLDAIAPTQIRREMIVQDQTQSKDLNIIIKANTHGSAEAVSAALQQLTSKQIFVKIVHIGIGDISEADVMLASASNAIVIGFSVKEDQNALRIATNEGIDIRKYDIIYQILEDIEKTMLGLLKPEFKEIEIGTAEVRQIFNIGKTIKIAGCYVTEGKIVRNKTAQLFRNGKEIHKGNIDQLKRFKEDAKEVAQGFECGISFNKFNDIQEGDIIKVQTLEEIERDALV
ncbi:MAG: translation initiation factor IF-2 [Candidatus Gastranaerophilales bacterium]|nr:translation initiation factor IF-2 [Candidatus Gastranaerophilales bacterium]